MDLGLARNESQRGLALIYEPLKPNETLTGLFRANLGGAGLVENPPEPEPAYFSSDVGNVSQAFPTIQPVVAITDGPMAIHTHGFREAAATALAHERMGAAAAARAWTAVDLLAVLELAGHARREFEATSARI